jgi:GH43 family beta-xylosidase
MLASLLALALTFTNPVARDGADPWVVKHDGNYFYCYAAHGGVEVSGGTASLLDVFSENRTLAWKPEANAAWSKEIWAPELHFVDDAWWIYVAADDGENANHRMQVLTRREASPLGEFKRVGELKLPGDKWAIDATVMTIKGKLYCIWSGWPGGKNEVQNLYICAMRDPATPIGERVLISTPQLDWEKRGGGPGLPLINEGPTGMTIDGKSFITYSASGSWSDHYCIGLLELIGSDPLKPESWKKHEQPILEKGNNVFGPGHASIVPSPDDSEWWLVFHAAKHAGAGWNRQVHAQKLEIDAATKLPRQMTPIAPGTDVAKPSGEK